MSTKIYIAYRMSATTFSNTFLPSFREHILRKVVKDIKKLAKEKDPTEKLKVAYEKATYSYSFEEFTKKQEKIFRYYEVFDELYAASKSALRNPYCFDCSLNIWWYKNKFYIIPIGEHNLYANYKLLEGVEDFSYWNNSDGPEEIDEKSWSARGKLWNEICLDDWNSGRLLHEIIDIKTGIGVDFLADRLLPQKDSYRLVYYVSQLKWKK